MTTHGGLVERALESVGTWLRLAAVSTVQAALAHDRNLRAVEAEHHGAAAERYEEAARNAERVAEACRIQAEYHRSMAATRGQREGTHHG
jgi:hypothetical protein